jgi:hypothetical protein
MRRTTSALILVIALVVVACSGGGDADTTTTTDSSTTTLAPEPDVPGGLDVEAMCRTLELFSASRVPPPTAAESLMFVDLEGATSQEMAAYGDLLIGAPSEGCPAQFRYAEAIAYWLGF